MKKEIHYSVLPRKAYLKISKRQRSYIDEFKFYQLQNGNIEAWYAGEKLAIFDGEDWKEPNYSTCYYR